MTIFWNEKGLRKRNLEFKVRMNEYLEVFKIEEHFERLQRAVIWVKLFEVYDRVCRIL